MNSIIIKADNKKAIKLFKNSEFHVYMSTLIFSITLFTRLLNDVLSTSNIFLQLIKLLMILLSLYLLLNSAIFLFN